MTDDGPYKKHKLNPAILRLIAACQRCRVKKIKCDQNFPKCSKCSKAGQECVGIDPATGRQVARLYVFHLEEKVRMLESRLKVHGLEGDMDLPAAKFKLAADDVPILPLSVAPETMSPREPHPYLGASLGVSFAKLMMTAVKMNTSLNTLRQEPLELTRVLQSVRPAILPPKATAQDFVRIYFAQSNSQLPILHRERFLRHVFEPVYGAWDTRASLALKYTAINVAACGERIPEEETWFYQYKQQMSERLRLEHDTSTISEQIEAPPEFHRPLFFLNVVFAIASSAYHLQYLATISEQFKQTALKYVDLTYHTEDPLEQLEAVLLLAVYLVMRPSVPGVWYVLGTALRICVDLGLHAETQRTKYLAFTRDRRRRLFWCLYLLDRQVCFYLGRPVGIPDDAITARLPSALDDAFIVEDSPLEMDYSDALDDAATMPSYKSVALSIIEIRQLQGEVQRILYENGPLPRAFETVGQWRAHMHGELERWRNATPKTTRAMNCDFHVEFFALNYNHTLLALNGLSPRTFKLSPDAYRAVLEALKNLMLCYTLLQAKKAINYTWAAVHNLFIAGTSYLFALYNSPDVRRHNHLHEVKKVTEECISVLTLLMPSCDAARSCSDTFQVLAAAVLKLRYNEDVAGAVLSTGLGDPPSALKHLLDGCANENLANLVEGLVEESSEDFSLPRFEWVSRKNSSSSGGEDNVAANTPVFGEAPDLDTFFLELANLLPVSSVRDNSDVLSVPGAFSVELHDDKPVPLKDGRRVYEIIQQMPNEAIWDQFFTTAKSMAGGPLAVPMVKSEPESPL